MLKIINGIKKLDTTNNVDDHPQNPVKIPMTRMFNEPFIEKRRGVIFG